MKFKSSLLLVVMLAFASLYAGSAEAARRTSLAGSVLIEDKDDIFTFPQLILDYRNLIAFDYGVSSSEGSGVMLFGSDNMAFGLAVHRAEVTDSDVAFGNLWDGELQGLRGWIPPDPWSDPETGEPPFPGHDSPLTIVDLLFSTRVGEGAFGARLAIGNSGTSETPEGGDESSDGQTFVYLDLGYSMKGNFRLDAALGVFLDFLSRTSNGEDANSGMIFGIDLGGRGFYKMAEQIDLGFLAHIHFLTGSLDTIVGDTTSVASGTEFAILVGVGPVYHITENTTVAGYITLGYTMTDFDQSDQSEDDAVSTSSILLPGVRLAVEIELVEWLYFRSGLDYQYSFESVSYENTLDNGSRDHHFGWAAGIGIKIDAFRFDGSFSHSWLTSGPQFLGGGGTMFGIVSASYEF